MVLGLLHPKFRENRHVHFYLSWTGVVKNINKKIKLILINKKELEPLNNVPRKKIKQKKN